MKVVKELENHKNAKQRLKKFITNWKLMGKKFQLNMKINIGIKEIKSGILLYFMQIMMKNLEKIKLM